MKVKFDRKTKYREMQRYLIVFPEVLEKAKEQIKDIVSRGTFDFFGMTVEEFLQLQEKILPKKIDNLLKKRRATFFDYVKISNTFESGMMAFEQILIDTTIQETADEEAARAGLVEVTTEEAMLTFICEYFKLSSMEQAQKLTLYEYITARKITFNNVKYQKNLSNIQKIKI